MRQLDDCPKDVSFGDKVAFLATMPKVVQVIETHMAFVFLTADRAFKLKKPVEFGYFDQRTMAARAVACADEVRLNRPLAGDVYLGVIPLVLGKSGLVIGGNGPGTLEELVAGQVVDWLVLMRRLPADQMLDVLSTANKAAPSPAEVSALIAHLARFYRLQQEKPVLAGLYLAHFQREQAVNFDGLARKVQFLPDIALEPFTTGLQARIAGSASAIAARESARWVVEGYGDLRPEHVCLTTPPVVFDRVESALELRVIDVFDEVGYLAAECSLCGRPDLGEALMRELAAAGFALPPPQVQAIYLAFRLVTRARLALDHLRDPSCATPEEWPARARLYVSEAMRLLRLGASPRNA